MDEFEKLIDEFRDACITDVRYSTNYTRYERQEASNRLIALHRAALRGDSYAKRYQWLRDNATTHLYVCQYRDGIAAPINGQILDAVIDRAMRGDQS